MALPTTPNSLEGTTFELATEEIRRRMIMSVEGDWGTGKTDLVLTAPCAIAFFRFDLNTEVTVAKYASKKRIYKSNIAIPRPDDKDAQRLAEGAWAKFQNDYDRAVRSQDIRSIIWDTATEIWELCRLQAFGRLSNVMPHHYVQVNNSVRELIKRAYDADTNLVMIHRLKDQWENYTGTDGKEKGKKTGKKERAGFSDIGFACQIMVQTLFDRDEDEEERSFKIRVLKCTQRPQLTDRMYGSTGPLR